MNAALTFLDGLGQTQRPTLDHLGSGREAADIYFSRRQTLQKSLVVLGRTGLYLIIGGILGVKDDFKIFALENRPTFPLFLRPVIVVDLGLLRDETGYEGLGLRIKNLVYIGGHGQTLVRHVLVYLHCLRLITIGNYLICVVLSTLDRLLLVNCDVV